MEHDLPGILDGADEPVTVEELEGVVRRAGQRRRATLIAGAAALLAVGALGGALARGSSDDRRTGLAAEGGTAPAPAPPTKMADAAMGIPAPGFGMGLTFTPLFRRDSHGVAIRAYRIEGPDGAEGGTAPCSYKPDMVHAGLSNAAAVSTAVVPSFRGGDPANQGQLKLAGAGTFGVDEKEPATWAIVEVDGTVATVRLTAGGATDSMAPQGGVAVLVVPGATTDGTVEALKADGSVLASRALAQPDSWMPDPACAPKPCDPGSPPPDAPAATTIPAGAPVAPDAPVATPVEPARDLPCGPDYCVKTEPAPPTTVARGQEPASDPGSTVASGGGGSSNGSAGVVCAEPPVPPVTGTAVVPVPAPGQVPTTSPAPGVPASTVAPPPPGLPPVTGLATTVPGAPSTTAPNAAP